MTDPPHSTPPPVPDPTVLTTQQITRAAVAERDYVDGQLEVLRERLTGIDRATEVLNETVNRTPTVIQTEIAHLRELMFEKFQSVNTQFQERDTRQERESRDNKVAVDAAFAAQKEAAAQQDQANQKAIDKSELATAETMKAFGELFRTTTDNIKEQMSGLELKVTQLIAGAAGGKEKAAGISSHLMLLVALGGFLLLILGYFATRTP